jgi:hypothetical protein
MIVIIQQRALHMQVANAILDGDIVIAHPQRSGTVTNVD